MTTIRKAVFPVAGMGTRFLPATKANPKEMLPVVDKPLIQYAVEEAIAIGVTQLIFITSSTKRSIEDHFDSNYELESKLEEQGKYAMLSVVRDILPRGVSCVYVRQAAPLGLGHAILCAQEVVGHEPFAVLLADDLIDGGDYSCLEQMLPIYRDTASSVLAVQAVSPAETEKYGIIGLATDQTARHRVTQVIEKPKSEDAPSCYASVGRYILTPAIFNLLQNLTPGAGGEIQLTDAIAQLARREEVYAHFFEGRRYDCGSKLGYLQAVMAYALKHPEIGAAFRSHLENSTILPVH